MPKNKIPDHLPIHMLLQMANAACKLYGFKKLIGSELNSMYTTKRVLPPIIRQNENGMLWVDKWYIAVQLGDSDVKYLYLTRHHIFEEETAYRLLKNSREQLAQLPEDIRAQFLTGKRWMCPTERYFYFSPDAEKLGLRWVVDWRAGVRKELETLKVINNEKRSA